MSNVYRQQAEDLAKELEILQEKQVLLERLAELEGDRGLARPPVQDKAKAPAKAAPKPADPKVKVATPKKRAKAAAGDDRAGVPTDDGKVMDLPTLLENIGQQVQKPLQLPDFVILVREAGYNTKAKDFSNMVYQALLKLVKRKVFEKNAETRAYTYVKQAA